MTAHWYAMRSKPRKEDVLWRQLVSQGVEVFYPRLRVNPVNPRAQKIKPYFPGYMFIYANLEETGLSTFQWMPYAMGLVYYGDEPARVPDNLINEVRQRVEAIAAAGGEQLVDLKPGDRVRIERGPFAGFIGIFDTKLPGTTRVRVLLEFINKRQVSVELGSGEIEKK
jgi:transcriptional antiterminator RfaH